jgi:small-conductance mechanosensitive channel
LLLAVLKIYLHHKLLLLKSIEKRLHLIKCIAGAMVFFLLGLPVITLAQQWDTSHAGDSLQQIHPKKPVTIVEKARQFNEQEIKESNKDFKEDLYATRQQELLEAIKKETFSARDFVKQGIDTAGLTAELDKINKWYLLSSDGIFINTGTAQTYRNLATSRILVQELLNRLQVRKTALDVYNKRLLTYRNRIDSFATDSALFMPPSDSAAVVRYFTKLVVAATALKPADSILRKTIINVQLLQEKVNTLVTLLETGLENIENYQKELSDKTFERDFPNLGRNVYTDRPFKDVIHFSIIKNRLALYFYTGNNIGKICVLVLLCIFSFIFLRSLKERLKEDERLREDLHGQLVLRYPLFSAILVVTCLFQFIFIQPPFIFSGILWLAAAIALTIIFRGFISRYWMRVWIMVVIFFIAGSCINFMLQATVTERWLMLALSVTGFIINSFIVITGNRQVLKEKWIVYFIGLTAIMEAASTAANIYGRYNLSKMLLTTGFFNIIIGISFLWTVRLINEGLQHARDLYTAPDKRLFYINFDKVGNEVPVLLRSLLVIGWFILFGRNFYAFKRLTDPVTDFLFMNRTIGAYSFSIQSILLFFGILLLATIVSRIVSFFASDQHDASGRRTKGVGSWLLLIRISIISIGLFIAFAAAGIPVDRITIIIGALSVGIGFGLQALINNLVSGLIISFEKPVNVGDIVEIGGKAGLMKSIGFRSSILRTWDGAEIIIPNGDILNEHLVNWTLNDHTRRIELPVAVAYGTDLEKAKHLLVQAVGNDERILKKPAPVAIATNFGASAIDLQLFCWVKHVKEWHAIKSDAIIAVQKIFAANNIAIPFPQQDVYLHPDTSKNNAGEQQS